MDEPVTVHVVRTVRPGFEAEFEAKLHEFIAESLTAEDAAGVHVLRPAAGSGSRIYGILRRFKNAKARAEFYASPKFAQWEAEVAHMVEGEPGYEALSGLETWFALPGNPPVAPPPRWKMAAVTLLAVFPLSLVLQKSVGLVVKPWHPLLQTLTISICMVGMLTWVLMPNLSRALEHWLHPELRKTAAK
ncbi:antibiotic biosynthesis monooxygenase [bacterium]|nr:MAG: antibiotic biosynthesis monooxygenase [bacterium]